MILDRLGKELIYFDGGTGTLLQERGLKPGELPETWSLEHADDMIDIARQYYEAGSDIVLSNTFGANALKFHDSRHELDEIVKAAIENVRKGAKLGVKDGRETYVGLDIGPTGKLLKPMGDLDFEDAYQAFAEVARLGEEAGADLIHIETMSDTYEVKAAVLAAKENTSLPVFATMIFDDKGKLLTGGDVPSVVAMLEGLRVDALGINCGMGPEQMMPILDEILQYASVPVIVKPNAGLPKQKDGEVYYDVEPEEFGRFMAEILKRGASLIGGCCGTTPAHIRAMVEATKDQRDITDRPGKEFKNRTIVSSYGRAVELGGKPMIIGERINPTGKKKFKQALKDHDIDYILREAISQQDAGAHILDVNVGLPDIDEPALMREVVQELQSVTSLPLQIDTVDISALEAAMRIYNGKPMVNSVNGKQSSMDAVFPLIKKYGGVVVGLTLDEDGIPATVVGIEYDPNRSANIALICYADGEKAYILAPEGLTDGMTVMNGADAEVRVGNCLPLSEIPVGTQIHNIELYPGKGGQLVRSAGNSAQLMAKEGKYATLRLPSGEMRMVPIICRASIGVVGNGDHNLINVGKAGRKRHMGIRPTVRGSVMNPNDHPHGGGEGKTSIGRPGPCTPWGKPALGLKTRKKNKASNKLIVRRRDGKAIK